MPSIISETYGEQATRKGFKSYEFQYKKMGKARRYTTTIKARNLTEATTKFKKKYKGWGEYHIISIT